MDGLRVYAVPRHVRRGAGFRSPSLPSAASGATALAEASSKEDSWRWQVFSTGTIVGLIFGFFYLAIPIFTRRRTGQAYHDFADPVYGSDSEHRAYLTDGIDRL